MSDEAQGRARRLRVGAGAAGAVAVVAALAWLLGASSLLAVDRVTVTGEQRVPAAQVLAAARVRLGTPLARVDTGGVERRVAALAPVAHVDVVRHWPGTLQLRVTERQPVLGVLAGGTVTLLDRTGVPFARAATMPPGVVRLQVAEPGPRDPSTVAALAVLEDLPADLRGRTAIVRAPSPGAVSLLLRDGRQVVWGAPGRTDDKAAAVQALLRLPGSVYDVTSPDVVVRKEPSPR